MARRKTRDDAPGWVWMLFGLSLGLIVAFVVYLRGREAVPLVPPPSVAQPAPSPQQAPSADVPETEIESGRSFDFYEMLPQFEVVIPDLEPEARERAIARAVEQPGLIMLQAGAFTSLADADRRQANLALLGVESRIQRVTIDDDVIHRVRAGPFDDLARANEVRRRLRDARIETILVKVPE